jgi:hypothetical protein
MSDKLGLSWLKGMPLVSAITSVCSAAFLLFGYDQGVMSGKDANVAQQWLSAANQSLGRGGHFRALA